MSFAARTKAGNQSCRMRFHIRLGLFR